MQIQNKDLVRISKTCKKLKEHAGQTSVLRAAAECILGKAFLTDLTFRHMITSNDQATRDENGSYVSGALQHPRLVRSFICLASSKEINNLIFIALNEYILLFAGFEKSNAHGMLTALRDMLYELKRSYTQLNG
ncbi:hypothetical protein CTI12_AA007710 [Artemisia annua]|uniref:Uncharacterized protein n=1 Tax=Artemisia annua TaxID=35608 RepID=A0A2U1QJI3_ARTAN|nr:hypothetical protein CTI12_AA007710 [Artemisia annua]